MSRLVYETRLSNHLFTIRNRVIRALNADWLKDVVYQTVYHKITRFSVLITLLTNSNKAPLGFVVYGQYTMAMGCIQALRVWLCLRTALSRGIFAIYHTRSGLIA